MTKRSGITLVDLHQINLVCHWLFNMQDYPAEELLVVYDPAFKYGQNFYLVLTEEAKERILNVSAF